MSDADKNQTAQSEVSSKKTPDASNEPGSKNAAPLTDAPASLHDEPAPEQSKTTAPAFTPFVAKRLPKLVRRVWVGTVRRTNPTWFTLDPKKAVAPEKLPILGNLVTPEEARTILERQRQINHLPACPKDTSPRVLSIINQLPKNHFARAKSPSETSEITMEKVYNLFDFVLETMPPLHIASSLVGGEYSYTPPVVPQNESLINANADQEEPNEFFKFFDSPIRQFDYSDDIKNSTPENLLYRHTVNHCMNVLDLLKIWASKMQLIDQEYRRPSDGDPITILFFRRFVDVLATDFNTANQLGITLPDMRLMQVYDIEEIDLFILWAVAALQIDPDFREHLIPTWTLGNVIVMSPAVIMRFVAASQEQRSDLLYRMSPSGKLQTNGLLKTIYARSPSMPLYYEMIVPEQISLLFSGSTSLSTPTATYATLTAPELSQDTYLAPENEKTLNIVRNYVTRPHLDTDPLLSRDNLNILPSLPFFIEGLPGSGRTTLMKIIASRLHMKLIIVNCAPLVMFSPDDFNQYFDDLFTDAVLLNALVVLKDASTMLAEARYVPILTRHLQTHAVVCAFCVDIKQSVTPELEPYVTFKTKMTSNLKENAVSYWKQHLNLLPNADTNSVDMLDLSRALALQPFQIQKAARLAYYASDTVNAPNAAPAVPLNNELLQHAAGEQIAKNIGTLAFISEPEVTLDDVIVSDDIMTKIKQIIGSAKNRRRVLYEWGLSRRIRRGTGVICLFDGEPGTGKTHSAEAIARCLGLSLMRVNIASMVDKYIGETEKNLTKIFEQARPDMSLLLFDEADSLFTKRTSNVSKSNDRYSNMSVNVLLQLVERYEGVSILTTNLKNSIDPAFERRITYKIYFAMPKKEERIRLWKYMCPPDVVTAEPLDYEWLSELEMSGGEIKNAVLAGAFRAATMGRLLDTEILYDAGVTEATAAGRVMRHFSETDDGFN